MITIRSYFLVLGGTIDLPSAEGADAKTIAATTCHAFLNGAGSPLWDARGRILNPSGVNFMLVFCPLDRDNTIAKPLRVEVAVIDNSSPTTGTRDISCSLSAMNRTGVQISAGGTVSTSGTNSSGQVLVLPIPPTLFVRGTYVVKCTVPRHGVGDPSSGIASIYYEEP